MTPAEERVAWQAIQDAQVAAWPTTPERVTTTQGRQVTIDGMAAWSPSFASALLSPSAPHSTLNKPGVSGEWSRPLSPNGMIVYVHGAASIASVASYRKWADDLCIASSAHVLNLEYRRPPESRCPEAVDDVLSAIAWFESHNHPTDRMVLAGDSFGAGPVLAALIARRDASLSMPAGAYLLCPKVDYSRPHPKVPPFDRNPDTCLASQAMDGYFETVPATDVRASPYLDSLTGLPPILIHETTGEIPSVLAEARALRDKLHAAGNACTWREWDTVPHVWPTFGAAFAYSLEAVTEAGAWIRQRLA